MNRVVFEKYNGLHYGVVHGNKVVTMTNKKKTNLMSFTTKIINSNLATWFGEM